MATNEAVLAHLDTVRAAVNTAINTVNYYSASNSDMTNAARAATLAKVTSVPTGFQHASDCAICTAWDGSEE